MHAGDFDQIRVPSKYAARFAQCFSTTYETLPLHASHICDLPEVVAQSREEFSDGVGVITSEGMQLVVRLLPVRQQRALLGRDLAAVQIRMGGCKGVLARWDNIECVASLTRVARRIRSQSQLGREFCALKFSD